MHDVTDLPDDPSNGDDGEVVSVPQPDAGQESAADPAKDPGAGTGWRWFPETIGGALYLGMLVVALTAVLVVVFGDWRVGIRIFAGVLFAGAGLRLVLPAGKVGMLAVRSRTVDVGLHLAVGLALILLAGSIPDQPT